MKTYEVGARAEGALLAALIRAGYVVLMPFGVQRYDFVVQDRQGAFKTVQCKSGVLRQGAILFRTCSTGPGRPRQHYQGVVDFFGVYCHDNGDCYLVPVADVGVSAARLRVEESRNNQAKRVRLAADYLIS